LGALRKCFPGFAVALEEPGDINSYKVNKQGEYGTQVLKIFFTIKTFSSDRHSKVYTVFVAVLTFKVIQGE